MKTIYVTGSTGKAGQYIVQDLLDNGYNVVGIDKNPPSDTGIVQPQDYTFKTVDVTDFGQVLSSMQGCDAVIHMAAITNPVIAPEHEVFRVNMTSTWNILESAESLGITKIVLASSVNAIGAIFSKNVTARPLSLIHI